MLLRHAKSDWPDVPDRDRPLAKRGRRDAPLIGRWLHDHGYLPEAVVCSAARRTRETWELLAPELGGSPSVTFEPRAYAASALTLLYLVGELPAAYRAALLLGHNPAISELATSLVQPPAGDGAPSPPGIRFPTAAVAVLEFSGDWADLAPGQANLLDFAAPADFSLLCVITTPIEAVAPGLSRQPGTPPQPPRPLPGQPRTRRVTLTPEMSHADVTSGWTAAATSAATGTASDSPRDAHSGNEPRRCDIGVALATSM